MKIKLRPVEKFVISVSGENEIVSGKQLGDYIEVLNLQEATDFFKRSDTPISVPCNIYKLVPWKPKGKKK